VSRGFVPVPATAIRSRLAAAGFSLLPASVGEEVYERPHNRDARYVVRIYSSIQRGAGEVRACGEDAIRVVALFVDGKFYSPPRTVPIFKAVRVFRTGTIDGVLDRLIERAREAYAACNEHRRKGAA
jgi:hypothetical protein